MRGQYVHQIWQADPTVYAPPRYRRACEYDAFIPEPVADIDVVLPGEVAGVVSDAEKAIADLNRAAGPELMPLARLLLRTESIASSKVEGMQVDARSLARAEANQETGRRVGSGAGEILANIDAMQLSIERAADLEGVQPADFLDIHRVLLERAPNSQIAGRFRTTQNWIGGNDYNPCGAAFVPPPPAEVDRLLDDLCVFVNDVALPPLVQAAIAHAQFETIHPFEDGNGRTGRALVQVVLTPTRTDTRVCPPDQRRARSRQGPLPKGTDAVSRRSVADWIEPSQPPPPRPPRSPRITRARRRAAGRVAGTTARTRESSYGRSRMESHRRPSSPSDYHGASRRCRNATHKAGRRERHRPNGSRRDPHASHRIGTQPCLGGRGTSRSDRWTRSRRFLVARLADEKLPVELPVRTAVANSTYSRKPGWILAFCRASAQNQDNS